jgi:predicted RNA-binding Zn-ribbon protein involved in translation (DUF1610 family)
MTIQCTACEHRFETLGAAGDHVDCPKCGTEVVLIEDPARVLRAPPPPEADGESAPPPPPTSVSFPYSTKDGTPLPVVTAPDGGHQLAPEAEPTCPSGLFTGMTPSEVRADQAAAAELLARPPAPEPVALFVGGFTAELIMRVPGVEVRTRKRPEGIVVQANVYAAGGRRVQDSQCFRLEAIFDAKEPYVLGSEAGAAVARVMLAARST